uniref:Coiled-coil domain-containing protein 43 n=1 Tax=Cavia porcellus TaxID=10141 RepID=A0A286XAX5_CAVPO|nr:coiled-coil domain-containing protein 43 [Cavia porcellus]
MAAPSEAAAAFPSPGDGGGGGFGSWLDGRLEALGLDRAVYGAYILGVLQEEEEEEKLDTLQCILSAFLEEDSLLTVCKEMWSGGQNLRMCPEVKKEDEVQAIATLIEKQAQIVVKPRVVTEEQRQRKAALLAQYAEVTDEEDEPDENNDLGAGMNASSDKSLFRNTNLEDVLSAQKLERDSLRDESQRKKEQDKLQRERDRLAKQERKEKERKRTQRGERKR